MEIEDLPDELLFIIMKYVDARTVIDGLSRTSRRFWRVARSAALWRSKMTSTFNLHHRVMRRETITTRRMVRCVAIAECVEQLLGTSQPTTTIDVGEQHPVLAHVLSQKQADDKTLIFVETCVPKTVSMFAEQIYWRCDCVTLGLYQLDRRNAQCVPLQSHVLNSSEKVLHSVVDSPSAGQLYTASDNSVQCWDVDTFRVLTLSQFDDDLTRIRFWHDRNSLVATFCSNNQRELCFIDGRTNLIHWPQSSFGALTDFGSIDENYFMVANTQGVLHVADIRTFRSVGSVYLRPAAVCAFDFNSELARCYVATPSNELLLFKVNHRLSDSENLLENSSTSKLHFTDRISHVHATSGAVFVSDLAGCTKAINPFEISSGAALSGCAAAAFRPVHFSGDTLTRVSKKGVHVWSAVLPPVGATELAKEL